MAMERFYSYFATFLVGVIAGGLLLSTSAEKQFVDHLADWAAALGTWVIGYGAWKYAREGHLQRLNEAKALEVDRLHRRIVLVTGAIEKLTGLKAIGVMVERMRDLSDDTLVIAAGQFAQTVAPEAHVDLNDGEKECFDAEQLSTYFHIQRQCIAVANAFLVHGPRFAKVASVHEVPVDRLRSLANIQAEPAAEIQRDAGELGTWLASHLDALRAQRDAISG